MIIIEMCGGLGNQMFQYALYTKMKKLGKEVKLDLTSFKSKQSLRKFELDIFNVDYDIADEKDIRKYKKAGMRSRLFHTKRNVNVYIENLDEGYQPIIFSFDDKYLQGYWQCEKYFADVRDILLKKFVFPISNEHKFNQILSQIKGTESVSLHIRRGDYLNSQNIKIYGNICTFDYYNNAISYVRKEVKDAVFFLFTNEVEWVKDNIYEEGMIIVDCNIGKQDYLDMFLMSQCKHNIIANSSFSWWGAWLNENVDKKIISPARWFLNHEVSNQICDNFVIVES